MCFLLPLDRMCCHTAIGSDVLPYCHWIGARELCTQSTKRYQKNWKFAPSSKRVLFDSCWACKYDKGFLWDLWNQGNSKQEKWRSLSKQGKWRSLSVDKESDDHYQLTGSKNTESDIISKNYLQFFTLTVSTSITPIACTTHSLWVALTISGVPILICLL